MVRAVPIQPSFARGEISPRLWSRVDLSFYAAGLELCENFQVMTHGGVVRFPGTRFVTRCADMDKRSRLLPFEFSTEQAYVLEFGDQVIRFFRNGGLVYVEPTDAAVVNGTFDTDLSGWTTSQVVWEAPGRARFRSPQTNFLRQEITIDAQYVGVRHTLRFRIAEFQASSTLTFNIGTTAGGSEILTKTIQEKTLSYHVLSFTPTQTTFWIDFTGDADANGFVDTVEILSDKPVTIGTPYVEADLYEIQHTQSADVMFLAHGDYRPLQLSRYDNDVWTLAAVPFTNEPSEWGDNKWPRRVGFYEDRLCWAATIEEPQTIWLSSQTDIYDHELKATPADSDAMKFTISAGKVNAIQWLVEDQQLQFGTSGATRTLAGAGIDAPLTPNSVKGKRHSTFGAAPVQPVQVGDVTIYIGRFFRRVREFLYSLDRDRYVSPDLSILSEHITKPRIDQLDYAQDPDSVLWMVRADGQLIGLTYERDQEVAAWHRHKIAGGAADEWGIVESLTVIPGAARSELWLQVRRTINSVTTRYIEIVEATPEPNTVFDKENMFFVHSGLTYDGRNQTEVVTLGQAEVGTDVTATTAADYFTPGMVNDRIEVNGGADGRARITALTDARNATVEIERAFASTTVAAGWTHAANSVGGLGHLIGETVAILGDGAVVPPQVVSFGGEITIPEEKTYGLMHVGLPYRSLLRTLRPEAGAADGTAQGRLQRIHEIVIRVRNTLGLKYGGMGPDELDTIPFRKGGDPMDSSPPLFTGDLKRALPGGWGPGAQIYIEQSDPLPAEIQAIIPKLETTEA